MRSNRFGHQYRFIVQKRTRIGWSTVSVYGIGLSAGLYLVPVGFRHEAFVNLKVVIERTGNFLSQFQEVMADKIEKQALNLTEYNYNLGYTISSN